MRRLQAGCFLVLSLLATLPGIGLAWGRVTGNTITMDPRFEMIIWGLMLGGASAFVISFVMLLRGR